MFIINKIISDGENNFSQNKYSRVAKKNATNKWDFLHKISAKMQIWINLYPIIGRPLRHAQGQTLAEF